jgi:hypothetical protein
VAKFSYRDFKRMTTAERISKTKGLFLFLVNTSLESILIREVGDWYAEFIFIDASKIQVRFYDYSIKIKVIKK